MNDDGTKFDREPIVRRGGTEVVEATETESPDYWILGDNGEEYGVFASDIDDLLHVVKHLRNVARSTTNADEEGSA